MIDTLLTQPFTLYKKKQTRENRVSIKNEWEQEGLYLGRFDPREKTLVFQNGKQTYLQPSNFYCRANVPIVDGDRVELSSVSYDVLSATNVFGKDHHIECVIERVVR